MYVTLHNTGEFELPLAYFHLDGDLFNLPAGPVSFAAGLEYRGERWTNNPDSENASFDAIGTFNFQASKVNRDVWGTYQEVRIPVTSPAWKLPGAYSLEFDIAEREEWYSQNTSATSVLPAEHSQFDAQKPKFSVRWQPLDPKWIGALTLRGSYSEGFHAPTLPDLTPAAAEIFLVTPSENSRSNGENTRRHHDSGTLARESLPEAGGCLRMVLWSGLQSEMDQRVLP